MLADFVLKFRPPRIAMALLLASAAMHYAWYGDLLPSHGCALCFAVLGSSGFAVMIWAWSLFRKRNTAICPTSKASALVVEGPFRFSRHPMYLGISLMLAAVAWGVGSPVMILAPAAFLILMHSVFVPYEERRMLELFGSEYRAYAEQVRRWI